MIGLIFLTDPWARDYRQNPDLTVLRPDTYRGWVPPLMPGAAPPTSVLHLARGMRKGRTWLVWEDLTPQGAAWHLAVELRGDAPAAIDVRVAQQLALAGVEGWRCTGRELIVDLPRLATPADLRTFLLTRADLVLTAASSQEYARSMPAVEPPRAPAVEWTIADWYQPDFDHSSPVQDREVPGRCTA